MNGMRKGLGITGKLVLSSTCIFAALFLAMTLYSVGQLRQVLYAQNVRLVQAQVLNWIEANTPQITITRDPGSLDRLVRELRTRRAISYVVMLDANSQVLAQTGLPAGLSDRGPARGVAGISSQLREMSDSSGRRFVELATPIKTSGTGMSAELQTMFELASKDTIVGQIRAGIEQREIDRELTGLAPRHILLYALLVSLALVVNVTLANRVASPVKTMARVAKQISAGDFSERVSRGVDLHDEVGALSRNFNQMADRLAEHQKEMNRLNADLERKVAERTLELEQANHRLQELDTAKSDFLSTVSHELRTPLTSIKAFAQILLDSPLDEKTRTRHLDIIDKETDRLTRLITDLLDLARIERREMSWTMADADLREVVSTAVAPLAASSRTQQIRVESADGQPLRVSVDADRIQQVVTNLVGNAMRFSLADGEIRIRAEETAVSGPRDGRTGQFAVVAVSDNGPGIALEERERIFTRFYRPPTDHAGRSGTGLGLAISREIVRHHGGEIWVESKLGFGSTFFFTLPLVSEAPDPVNAGEIEAMDWRNHAQEGDGV
jgi:signal transduction histidine kinase